MVQLNTNSVAPFVTNVLKLNKKVTVIEAVNQTDNRQLF